MKALLDISHLSGGEKAAVLVMYLGEDVVRKIFTHFTEDEIRRVGSAISGLDRVSPEVLQAVIAEFATDLSASLYLKNQGTEYLRKVFPNVLGEERADRLLRTIEPLSSESLRDRFAMLAPGAVAARLSKEHPQTIAVACALLGSAVTADLLPRLPVDSQAEVLTRLASLKEIPLELLQDLELLLADIDEKGTQDVRIKADGTRLVADTLGSLGGEAKENLLYALSEINPEMAEEISKQLYKFEILENADNKGIQNLLKEVERSDLAMALKGAAPATRDRFFSNMSSRGAEFLKDDMEVMGAVRRTDFETAQQLIVAAALRLEEAGQLMLLGGADDVVM